MKNSLGRDNFWDDATWQEIDKAVLVEVGRVRVAQKVFPSESTSDGSGGPSSNVVSADVFDPKTMSIAEGQTKPYIEISVEFPLTLGQVNGEATLKTARTLARFAAKELAMAEDITFFQGKRAALPPQVRVGNRDSAGDGLLGAAVRVIDVDPISPGVYGGETFKAVTRGIAELIKELQPAPHALFLESRIFADTYAPLPTTLVTTADRLIPLLQGGFYDTGALPARTGLLVSLAGEPTTLYVNQDAITAYMVENQGIYRFRVFERVQFVARDPRCFVRLDFK